MKQDEIKHLLPGVFQRTLQPGNPLAALLEVMEGMHRPSEEVLARLETFFNPYQAPDAFVPYLARWVDLDMLLLEAPEELAGVVGPAFPAGTGRLRELVAAAAYLSKWRGTAGGLLLFLETATGVRGFEVDEQVEGEDGAVKPFHIRIRATKEAAPLQALIRRIIQLEKPAYVTYELLISE
jgi:phage tail-like protein